MTVQSIYAGWRLYNDLVTDPLAAVSTDELALRASSGDLTSSAGWPIWAMAGPHGWHAGSTKLGTP